MLWHKCRYNPEHLDRKSSQRSQNYYQNKLGKVPDLPEEYGFEYGEGGWEFQEENIYYSVPCDDGDPMGELTYSMPNKSKKTGKIVFAY